MVGALNRLVLLLKPSFSWVGLIIATLSSVSVLANDAYFLSQNILTINMIFIVVGVLLALLPYLSGPRGFAGVVFLLPLSAGMSQQIDAFLGISILVLPNAGLDLVAGFFIGCLVQLLIKKEFSLRSFALPWPMGLLLLVITFSTAIAIIRNIRQSATETSIFGLLFNLMHFRPIGWHDDYMPIADWIAYGSAGALIITLLWALRGVESPNRLIFRSLVAGLVLAFFMGLLQSMTGLGLPSSMQDFRRDSLGFAAIGFQPDIHAFAGHMLLGAVGLWAYFQTCRGKLERAVLLAAVSFSWIGLLISKSRASLLIAICASLIILLVYIWQEHRKWFYSICMVAAVILAGLVALLILNSDALARYSLFSWLVEPIQLLKNKDFTNLSELGGASGSRFEIWSAAFNMIKAFPLMGVGQGNFYHLSADVTFSKSHFLALNGGENAHNYFFQTFADLGLVGMSVFVLAFIFPIIVIKNRQILVPAALGILALFLGNLYSHSFLVRENLLLCATLLGLIYFLAAQDEKLHPPPHDIPAKFRGRHILVMAAVFVLGAASIKEIYQSFYTKIFEIGVNCFQARPLTEDGWTSGVYEMKPPYGTQNITFMIYRPRYMLAKKEFELRIDALDTQKESVATNVLKIASGESRIVTFTLPASMVKDASAGVIRMRIEGCFTPRNLGGSQDPRILGLQIQGLKAF